MDPLDQLSFPLQLLVGAATFGLIFIIGRFGYQLYANLVLLWTVTWAMGGAIESDETRRGIGVPARFAAVDPLLLDTGYVVLGVVRWTYPRLNMHTTSHIRVSPDETTVVRFNEDTPPEQRVSILTWFEDDSLIVTEYPHGASIETPRFISRFVRGSMTAAYAYHARRVAEWTAQGRVPKRIPDLTAYLRQQAYFRQHYRPLLPKHLRIGLALTLVPASVAVIGAIGVLVSLYKAEPAWVAGFGVLIALSVWARGKLERDNLRRSLHPSGAADDVQAAHNAG